MRPPVPYRGSSKYIFISYAHKDSHLVWPIISRMQRDGFRIWYDDGIDPGTEWDENIASHVAECGYFIAFLSANYLASNNCKDELNFSRDQGKPQLLIYLEDVDLPQGMAMRMGRNQAVFFDRYEDKEVFYVKLYEAQGIDRFAGTNEPGELPPAPKLKHTTFHPQRRRRSALSVVLTVLILAAAAVGIYLGLNRGEPEKTGDSVVETTTQPREMSLVTNVVLADNVQIKVTALDMSVDSRYFVVTLAVENKSNARLYVRTDNFYLNGANCEPDTRGYIDAKEVGVMELHWPLEDLAFFDLDPEKITMVEGEISGSYEDNSGDIDICPIVYYPYGEQNASCCTYIPREGDVVIMDTEELFAVTRGHSYDGETDYWKQDILVVNKTDEDMVMELNRENINGYSQEIWWSSWVRGGGRMIRGELIFSAMEWKTTDYERVYRFTGEFDIYNWESYYKGKNNIVYPFAIYPEGEATASQLARRELKADDVLLLENSTLRVAYLGAREYGNSQADLIYLENLSDQRQAFELVYDSPEEEDIIGVEVTLDPGEQKIYLAYRQVDVFGNESEARLDLSWYDDEMGFNLNETVTFQLQDAQAY